MTFQINQSTRILAAQNGSAGQNIKNQSKFFQVSGFFIAYLILYAVSVPLIMRFVNKNWRVLSGLVPNLKAQNQPVNKVRNRRFKMLQLTLYTIFWIFYALVVPFILILVWGIYLACQPEFSIQFGIGIALIGIFLLFLFLGFSDWYGHKWQMTVFTMVMLFSSTVAAFMYCFAVIFLPDYFTYNGTTAIFMSLNYIFSSLLIFMQTATGTVDNNQSNEKFVKVDLLLETLVEQEIFSR